MQKNLNGASVLGFGLSLPPVTAPTPFSGTTFYLNTASDGTAGTYVYNVNGDNKWFRVSANVDPSSFVRRAGDTMTGKLSFSTGGTAIDITTSSQVAGGLCGSINWNGPNVNYSSIDTVISVPNVKGELVFKTMNAGASAIRVKLTDTGFVTPSGNKYWNAENDGHLSGLDADLLDGYHGDFYRNLANMTGTLDVARLPFMPVQQGGAENMLTSKIFIGESTGLATGQRLVLNMGGVNYRDNWPINADSASKLSSGKAIVINGERKVFDGTQDVSFTISAKSITTLKYNQRGELRSEESTGVAVVEDIGTFIWNAGPGGIDDDETCFKTPNGYWSLNSVGYLEYSDTITNLSDTIANLKSRISELEQEVSPTSALQVWTESGTVASYLNGKVPTLGATPSAVTVNIPCFLYEIKRQIEVPPNYYIAVRTVSTSPDLVIGASATTILSTRINVVGNVVTMTIISTLENFNGPEALPTTPVWGRVEYYLVRASA